MTNSISAYLNPEAQTFNNSISKSGFNMDYLNPGAGTLDALGGGTYDFGTLGMQPIDANTLGSGWGKLPQANLLSAEAAGGDFWSKMFGSTTADGSKTMGAAGTALGVMQGIGNAFMGMKQYGLAKDQLAQSKKQFDLNFGAQKKTTNAALGDRQAARVASNPGAYQSVGDYMKENGI